MEMRHQREARAWLNTIDMAQVSPPRAGSVKPALRLAYRSPDSPAGAPLGGGARGRALVFRVQGFSEFARDFDEARCQADILVDGIALIVARNDLRAGLIGHGRCDLIETGVQ